MFLVNLDSAGQTRVDTHGTEMRHDTRDRDSRKTHLSNVEHIDGKCRSLIQECVLNLIYVIPYYSRHAHNA